MKIAIISTYNVQCGIATYTNYLGKALVDQGHNVVVFAEDVRDNESLDPDMAILPYNRCWNRYGVFNKLKRALLKWKPDVVHIQYEAGLFPRPTQLEQLVRELRRDFPVVITFHDVSNPLVLRLMSKTSCNIVHHITQFEAISRMGAPKSMMIAVIPHGSRKVNIIDSNAAKASLGIPLNKKVISVFGFVGKYKGHYNLLVMFSGLLKLEPNAFLLFAGGVHPIFSELVQNHTDIVTRTMNANPDKMRMTGFILEKDLDTYIAASDIIVFPHIVHPARSISGATHAVLGGGKPIVTTMFSLYDDLTNGVNCLRLPDTINMYSLPTVFYELLDDKNVCKRLGDGAKKLAEETSWGNVASLTSQVYDKVVEDNKK